MDNHDEFARISYYCDGDSFRIKNALTLLRLSWRLGSLIFFLDVSLKSSSFDSFEPL